MFGEKLSIPNGEELADSYDLNYGSNTFKITATDVNGNSQTVTLSVTRDAAPTSTGKTITVTFTLYGDEKHGDSEVHTYKNNKKNLSVWISQKSYTVDSGSTVLDVFEAALKEAKLTWENDGGNYITEIDGLSEFDNGPLSGWMYLLNGSHSDLGVAERTLKSGDKIVFHYTDDYTQEQGSESFADNSGSSSGTSKSGNNGGVSAGVVKDSSTGTRSGTVLGDFKDVVQTQWYYEPVKYVVEKGIMKGVSDSGFAPDSSMNRAMLVTVLQRLESEPQVEAGSFDDVPSDAYYAKAVAWASENGLTSGVTDKSFAPELNITREQIAVFLYRYAQYKSMDVSAKGDIASFDDADSISSWAQQAMEWAVGSGIINGSDGKLMAGNNATRAEVAAMLMRFIEK